MAVYSNGQYRQYCSMGSNGGVYMIWSAAEARQLYLPQDFKSVGLQNYKVGRLAKLHRSMYIK